MDFVYICNVISKNTLNFILPDRPATGTKFSNNWHFYEKQNFGNSINSIQAMVIFIKNWLPYWLQPVVLFLFSMGSLINIILENQVLQIAIILDKFMVICKMNSKAYSMNIYFKVRKVVKVLKLGFELWLFFFWKRKYGASWQKTKTWINCWSYCSHKFDLFYIFLAEYYYQQLQLQNWKVFFTISINISIIQVKFYSWMKKVDHMDDMFFVVLTSFGFGRN